MQVLEDRCEWCDGRGLVPVYHRLYRGLPTVLVEVADRFGEIHPIRRPGVIAVHCTCPLGVWTRDRTSVEDRRRIPTLSDIFNGRIPYTAERPDVEQETEGLTDAARAFVRGWKAKFPCLAAPRAARANQVDVANRLRERAQRIEGGAA